MSNALAGRPGASLHIGGTKSIVEGGREKLETRNSKLEIGKAESGHDPDRRRGRRDESKKRRRNRSLATLGMTRWVGTAVAGAERIAAIESTMI
jgi:hypothetical protein